MADNNNKTDREIWEEHEKALKEEKKAEKAAEEAKDAGKKGEAKKQTTVRLRKGVKKTVDAEGNTVRIQKIKKNNIKKKLIVFIILACALLFVSIFARQLCPYDPYKQNLSEALQTFSEQTDSDETSYQGSSWAARQVFTPP